MNGSSYLIAFERLKAGILVAEQARDVDALEQARGAMDAFVASLVTDPRRFRALAAASRTAAGEVERLAAGIDLPIAVLDPVHDPAYARLWLAWLDDDRLRMLQRVMADEVNRRRQDQVAKVYAAPRRRPAAATALSRLFG
jgi:hypothetical protein